MRTDESSISTRPPAVAAAAHWPRAAVRRLRRRARRARRWLRLAALDLRELRRGERDPLTPPRRKGLPSQGAVVGYRLADAMEELGGMESDSTVLDIGCGSGRIAAALARRLDAEATYEGFDIVPASIRWCRKAIGRRYPNFNFQIADLENAEYNPGGAQRASEFTFPYPDATFDVSVAGSLFTHLRPFESDRYLEEAARVLRPGGHLLATWFLINDEAERLLAAGRASRRSGFPGAEQRQLQLEFEHVDERGNPFRSPKLNVPEKLIAVDEENVREQYRQAGLRIIEISYGRWPGREQIRRRFNQDLIVAERA